MSDRLFPPLLAGERRESEQPKHRKSRVNSGLGRRLGRGRRQWTEEEAGEGRQWTGEEAGEGRW